MRSHPQVKEDDSVVDAQAHVRELGLAAREASRALTRVPSSVLDAVLADLAAAIRGAGDDLAAANEKDIQAAQDKGLNDAMIDRLRMTPERIQGMAAGVEVVAGLDDPVGRVLWETVRPNGLMIQRVSCPIGVLGMIYESRPNVTVDAASLCLKSRNAVILRGGSESFHSSRALHRIIVDVLGRHGLPVAAVSMVGTTDRAAVGAMLGAHDLIDVMIPRGGKGLTGRVMAEAKMPVFSHLDGICHIYVHPSVTPEVAMGVTLNAKMRRTGICGAMETLILDDRLDPYLAHDILVQLLDAGCAVVGDKMVQAMDERIEPATAEDWGTEYLDAKLSVCTVHGVEEAVKHINSYGSHHTDSILAEDGEAVAYFQQNVDSGIVMHNASTQFADGGEFGMGAEIGIATGKMHARGPVGLEQLCTYKYLVHGRGQTRP